MMRFGGDKPCRESKPCKVAQATWGEGKPWGGRGKTMWAEKQTKLEEGKRYEEIRSGERGQTMRQKKTVWCEKRTNHVDDKPRGGGERQTMLKRVGKPCE
jgi:hypothetical protein